MAFNVLELCETLSFVVIHIQPLLFLEKFPTPKFIFTYKTHTHTVFGLSGARVLRLSPGHPACRRLTASGPVRAPAR